MGAENCLAHLAESERNLSELSNRMLTLIFKSTPLHCNLKQLNAAEPKILPCILHCQNLTHNAARPPTASQRFRYVVLAYPQAVNLSRGEELATDVL